MNRAKIIFFISFLLISLGLVGEKVISNQTPVFLSKPLKDIPVDINGWHADNVSLGIRVRNILGVDDYLFRKYSKDDDIIYVYIGYYNLQKPGALIHSPKHCLNGEGWGVIKSEKISFIPCANKLVHANRLILEKDNNQQMVIYWYREGNRTIANEYMAKFYLIYDALFRRKSSGALIRISARLKDNNIDYTFTKLISFMREFYPYLAECFQDTCLN